MIIRKVQDRWRASQLGQWVEFQTSGTMFIWPQRFMRAMLAAFPKWLLWLWMALRFVPTPFEVDEWLPAIFALVLLLWPAISHDGWRPVFNWHRMARYRSAWRGSKSHRSWDERRAQWRAGIAARSLIFCSHGRRGTSPSIPECMLGAS